MSPQILKRSRDPFGRSIFYSAVLHVGLVALWVYLSGLLSTTSAQVSIAPGFISVGFVESQAGVSGETRSMQEESTRIEAQAIIPGPEVTESQKKPIDREKQSGGGAEAPINRGGSATGFAEGALVDNQGGWGNAPPIYPTIARKNGWEGDILLRVNVSAGGTTQSATVLQSSGYPILDDAAVSAVRRWRFIPAKKKGKPVDSLVEIPIQFRLRDKGSR